LLLDKGLELRFDIINLFDQAYEIRNGTGFGVLRAAPNLLAEITQRL